MRRILFFITLVAALTASGRTYKVSEVPNVHLTDSTRFVSNPDGILSPAAEAQINQMLRQLMRETKAEVACVAVDDIDPNYEIADFATDLFRHWGIGKEDVNSGLLLLIVKDRRQMRFSTGNGLEGLLPDGYLGALMREKMEPRFKEGDFDGGTVATLSEIARVLSSDEAREEVRSKYANNRKGAGTDPFVYYLYFCGVLALGSLAWVLATGWRTGNKTRFERYQAANKMYIPTLLISFIGLGIPLPAWIIVAVWRHKMRRGTRLCPQCGTRMNLVDEEHDNDYLHHGQDIEEKLGSVDYDVWLCHSCGKTEIIPYVSRSSGYSQCPVCKARAFAGIGSNIVKVPTTHSTGLQEDRYRCASCGFEDTATRVLPKLAPPPPPIIIPGGGGFRGGGGGGGGSWGGGTTSGGGATGGW